jgi:hypothetical protein
MERRDDRGVGAPAHRETEKVQMRMDDVKLPRCRAQRLFLHQDHRGIPVEEPCVVKAKCPGAAGFELSCRLGVSAREQRDLMSLPHQFLGEVGRDPFGPTVELRGHTFPERRQLSDLHGFDPF